MVGYHSRLQQQTGGSGRRKLVRLPNSRVDSVLIEAKCRFSGRRFDVSEGNVAIRLGRCRPGIDSDPAFRKCRGGFSRVRPSRRIGGLRLASALSGNPSRAPTLKRVV